MVRKSMDMRFITYIKGRGKPHKSDLVTDYPVDFFWGAKRLSAGITIPNAAVQQRLIEAINNGAGGKSSQP